MKLSNLKLQTSRLIINQSGPDVEISSIEYDSRLVSNGSMFICINGFHVDGHSYINSAIKNGASCIVVENKSFFSTKDYPDTAFILTKDAKDFLAKVASAFLDNPSDKLNIIGVTGTKGKTMTTFMLKSVFDADQKNVAISSTIKKVIKDLEVDSTRTTPESSDLQKFLAEVVKNEVANVIMEVSSLGIKRKRLNGIHYRVGIFLNLTQDHISEKEHENMDDYFNSKMKLFDSCEVGLVNIDGPYGEKALSIAKKKAKKVYTLSIESPNADIYAKNILSNNGGVSFDLVSPWYQIPITISMPGEFIVSNTLAVAGVAGIFDISATALQNGLIDISIPGRLEKVRNDKGFEIIIDYAHTPDSLRKILETFKPITLGKLILLFGCGGNRDPHKRPIMGRIAGEIADYVFITSDNPRDENPMEIVQDIESGILKVNNNYKIIPDRSRAIYAALQSMNKEDCLIIAGKGHETYQEIRGNFIKFDDREKVKNFFQNQADF